MGGEENHGGKGGGKVIRNEMARRILSNFGTVKLEKFSRTLIIDGKSYALMYCNRCNELFYCHGWNECPRCGEGCYYLLNQRWSPRGFDLEYFNYDGCIEVSENVEYVVVGRWTAEVVNNDW